MMTPDDLISYWSVLNGQTVHPNDRPAQLSSQFATDLQPLPWNGPLRTARVYVLLINPNLSDDDHEQELRPDFREALLTNLSGNSPYLYLQQRFADHPGNVWARRLFGPDIGEAQAPSICVIQLVAYHCADGERAKRAARRLHSSQKVIQFVHDWVLPRAKADEIGLSVARATCEWGFTSSDESGSVIVNRSRTECRGAFQTRNTRGGQLLRRFL
jgi:hypothetical protein